MSTSSRLFIPMLVVGGGIIVTGGIAWLTGAARAIWSHLCGWYDQAINFLNQPWGFDQIALGLAVPVAGLAIIIFIFMIILDL